MNKKGRLGLGLLIVIGLIAFLLFQSQDDGNGAPIPETQTAGINLFITDAGVEDIDSLNLVITDITLVGDKGTQKLFSGQMPVELKEKLVQKISGSTIAPDVIRSLIIRFSTIAEVELTDGEKEELLIKIQTLQAELIQRIEKGEIADVLIDIPIGEAVSLDGTKFAFEPKTPRITSEVKVFAQELAGSTQTAEFQSKLQELRNRVTEGVGDKATISISNVNNVDVSLAVNAFAEKSATASVGE